MSKKFGKFLLFSALAGAAAYGAYCYLQSKESTPVKSKSDDSDDDFDDFGDDLDEDITPAKERSYVSLNLDKAEAFASEAFQKAKEVIVDSVQQVKETVKSATETQTVSNGHFTDITPSVDDAEAAKKDFKSTVSDTASSEVTADTVDLKSFFAASASSTDGVISVK